MPTCTANEFVPAAVSSSRSPPPLLPWIPALPPECALSVTTLAAAEGGWSVPVAGKPTSRVAAHACRRWTLGGLVALAALVAACGYEPIVITVHNPTSQEYLLRLSWAYGEVHVLRVPPGKGASTASLQSGDQPLVELLRPDCAVLDS